MGDCHIRDVAERLAIKLRSSFRTIGYVGMRIITSTLKSEIKNLIKNYVVILCGGTLDVVRNNTLIGLSFILQFVKNTGHTNVIIINAPHRFDLEVCSCVNKEINAFNRKLNKTKKNHMSILVNYT